MTDIDTQPQPANPLDTDLVMTLTGTDAIHFLQGQTTADFENAEPGALRFAAFCNPKGRVIADVLAVIVSTEHVMMRGRQAVMSALALHLKPYLAFSKSTLTHSDWCISCRTVNAAKPTADQTANQTALVHCETDAITRIEIPRGDGIIECWQPRESAAPSHATALLPLAEVDMITARARVELDTMGAYLPQDLNYDLNGTVSFTKGCYTGQEIVARLHYRGTPKRRLYRALAGDTPCAVAPGARLSNAANRAVGSVVNRASPNGVQQLLIELTPEAASDSVLLGESALALSAIQACYEEIDQSTSPR